MSEFIQEYDFFDDEVIDHDQAGAIQAGKLISSGCMDLEIAAYGTAVYWNDDVHYFVSAKEKTILAFIQKCYLQGLYPMPPKYFYKRYPVTTLDESDIRTNFRLSVAEELQKNYSYDFLKQLHELTILPNTNHAMVILQTIMNELNSCFDLKQIEIFDDLCDILLQARMINVEGYNIARQWSVHEKDKLNIEPIKAGNFQRDYAGFSYRTLTGELKFFADAFYFKTFERKVELLSQGNIVTPILRHTYQADTFPEFNKLREHFKKDLLCYLDGHYIDIMMLVRELPSSVNRDIFTSILNERKKIGTKQEVEALMYYGYMWNVLKV